MCQHLTDPNRGILRIDCGVRVDLDCERTLTCAAGGEVSGIIVLMNEKILTDRQLRGGQGPPIVELAVSEMGFVWRPTSQHDTGVDGEIELRNPATGAMTGLIVKVQIKSTESLANETADSFDYSPERRDVRYWQSHNVPVILVICRPSAREAFWLPIRDITSGGGERKKFRFDKRKDRFDKAAAGHLTEFARATTPWANAPSLVTKEQLLSNLLPVTALPEKLFLGETSYSDPKQVGDALRERSLTCEFVLKNKRILTPRDLTSPQYQFLADQGNVEDFPVDVWANTDDADRKRDFVRLLNGCTRALFQQGKVKLKFDKGTGCYFFPASSDLKPYSISYMSNKKVADREVFKVMSYKGKVLGYRHSALVAHYVRHDSIWYLEVTPTYFFSYNGHALSNRHSKWLKRIKEDEKNLAVRGQLVMWISILTDGGDLLNSEYPFLEFGQPPVFELNVGLSDDAWRAHETAADKASAKISGQQFALI